AMIHQPCINGGEFLKPVAGAVHLERASYRVAFDLKFDSSSRELALMEDCVRRAKLPYFVDYQPERRLRRNSAKQDHCMFPDSAVSSDARASSNCSPPMVRSGRVETPAKTNDPSAVTAKSTPNIAAPQSRLSLTHASSKSAGMSAPLTDRP